jgi:repressor LexA
MGEKLTKRQREILEYLIKFTREKGYPPTLREIGRRFSISSPKGVADHLKALERKGYLKRNPYLSRGVELTLMERQILREKMEVPVIGRIAAGTPILATENIEEVLMLDGKLLPSGELFGLRVKGDSMIKAGIKDGDYVVIRRQNVALKGEIVAVLIGEEVTLKRYFPEKEAIYLKADNPFYKPIVLKEDIQILGKAVALFRRL